MAACPQVDLHGMDEGLTLKLNYAALCTGISDCIAHNGGTKTQFCREIDAVFLDVWKSVGSNKNVELGGRDATKTFCHGVTSYILDGKRVDGGWHIAISRTLHIALCTNRNVRRSNKIKIAEAYKLMYLVHEGLRRHLPKEDTGLYQNNINSLLEAMIALHRPFSKSDCNSVKYHWPRHWIDTRTTLGCSAAEKSLERKLSETQKKNFRLTNNRADAHVQEANRTVQDVQLRDLMNICDLHPDPVHEQAQMPVHPILVGICPATGSSGWTQLLDPVTGTAAGPSSWTSRWTQQLDQLLEQLLGTCAGN